MRFEGLKVGDTVVVNWLTSTKYCKVAKVGRVWFEVEGRARAAFRLEDGTSKSGYSHPRAWTVTDHDREERVNYAERTLRDCGIQVSPTRFDRGDIVLKVYDLLRQAIEAGDFGLRTQPAKDPT